MVSTFNNCVRRIDLTTRTVTRFAGTGAKGFGGDIEVTVGLNEDGTIVGVQINEDNFNETAGMGAKLTPV